MKRSLLTPAILLFLAALATAQTPQRSLDNFDTRVGVQVQTVRYSPPAAAVKDNETKTVARAAVKHYLPSPLTYAEGYKDPVVTTGPVEKTFVRPTAQVMMTSNYDDIQRENFRSNEAMRLTMRNGSQMRGYSTGDYLVDAYIVDSSRRYRVDPLLIYSQMNQESSFKPHARSYKGASGLMQLMPATARRLGVTDIYDPKQNIDGGVKYMRILLDMFDGDVNLALAGYNAGEGAVIKYGYQIPPYAETQDYVRRISARYRAISGAAGYHGDQSRFVNK